MTVHSSRMRNTSVHHQKNARARAQTGSNILSLSFSEGKNDSLNMFALMALFISGIIITGLGIYYIVVYKRAKSEVPKKVQTLGIINTIVGIVALLFSVSAFFFM